MLFGKNFFFLFDNCCTEEEKYICYIFKEYKYIFSNVYIFLNMIYLFWFFVLVQNILPNIFFFMPA